jgi:hypothetical protein
MLLPLTLHPITVLDFAPNEPNHLLIAGDSMVRVLDLSLLAFIFNAPIDPPSFGGFLSRDSVVLGYGTGELRLMSAERPYQVRRMHCRRGLTALSTAGGCEIVVGWHDGSLTTGTMQKIRGRALRLDAPAFRICVHQRFVLAGTESGRLYVADRGFRSVRFFDIASSRINVLAANDWGILVGAHREKKLMRISWRDWRPVAVSRSDAVAACSFGRDAFALATYDRRRQRSRITLIDVEGNSVARSRETTLLVMNRIVGSDDTLAGASRCGQVLIWRPKIK